MAIQGQLQMLCQAVGNGQLPPGVINYQQRPHGGHGHGKQHSGKNGGGRGYGGGGYNGGGGNNNGGGGGNQNTNGGGGGYNSGGGTATALATSATRTQEAYTPRQSSASSTGTTAARMTATWKTTTPVQHVPTQGRTTNARQHGPTPWVSPSAACTRPSFPAPSADRLHQLPPPPCAHQLHPHLLQSIWQQRAFSHDTRQLGFWTPHQSIPTGQQYPPPLNLVLQ